MKALLNAWFSRAAQATAYQAGRAHTAIAAFVSVTIWLACGPLFHYSDSWQLVINTATTIVTFLMVFLIQNTQTRDTVAMQMKLDELIRANSAARNAMTAIESMSEDQLRALKQENANDR